MLLPGYHGGKQLPRGSGPEAAMTLALTHELIVVSGKATRMFWHLQLVTLLVVAPVHHLYCREAGATTMKEDYHSMLLYFVLFTAITRYLTMTEILPSLICMVF